MRTAAYPAIVPRGQSALLPQPRQAHFDGVADAAEAVAVLHLGFDLPSGPAVAMSFHATLSPVRRRYRTLRYHPPPVCPIEMCRKLVRAYTRLTPEQMAWLDARVRDRTFGNRSHGLSRCVTLARRALDRHK